MSSYYRRHSRIFQFAAAVYLVPCSYNEQVDQFQDTVYNRLAFAVSILITVSFWFVDLKLMSVVYLNHLSAIMVILGSIEIAVYVLIAACTLLNCFLCRRRIVRMMNVLFRSDWLLDRYTRKEERYDNGRKFAVTMIVLLTMTCCNLAYHDDINTRLLSLTVAVKICCVCYLCFFHRICVGAIGMRMEQLKELFREGREGIAGRGQTLSNFIDRFELYAAQVGQVNRCFSFPLMIIVLLVVIEMVYLMFDCFIILELHRPVLEGLDSGYTRWFLRQLWQCIYMVLMLLVVSSCSQTSQQLQETVLCVQQLEDYQHRNTKVAKQLQRFMLHSLERDTRATGRVTEATYSHNKFFNFCLLQIFSAIITHTLILIQFDQMQPKVESYATKLNSTA